VCAAGRAAIAIRQQGLSTRIKSDGSPVSHADEAAEAIVIGALEDVAPDITVVSEENESSHAIAPPKRFFLVDPIDGTKEFMKKQGNSDFTVNVGLIEDGEPVMGLVYAPDHFRLFAGIVGGGAFEVSYGERRSISVRDVPSSGAIAVVSNHRANDQTWEWIEKREITKTTQRSSSIKFAMLAAGEVDVHPRFSPTMEWDTAAGHAVLRAAGGRVELLDGSPRGLMASRRIDARRTDYNLAKSRLCRVCQDHPFYQPLPI